MSGHKMTEQGPGQQNLAESFRCGYQPPRGMRFRSAVASPICFIRASSLRAFSACFAGSVFLLCMVTVYAVPSRVQHPLISSCTLRASRTNDGGADGRAKAAFREESPTCIRGERCPGGGCTIVHLWDGCQR
jgi:hypothetical protein